jgi:AraC-like DNA-binding protein
MGSSVSCFAQAGAEVAVNLVGPSMILTEDRVAYRGLLGAPTTRNLGALTVYVALESPFLLKIGGEQPARKRFAIVPPNVPHFITSSDKLVGDILIEPECVGPRDLQQLPKMIESAAVRQRLESAFDGCWQSALGLEHTSAAVDEYFFGRQLEPRVLDARIALAIRQIRERPCEQFFAASCAKLTGLSFSRFVHLFKEEIGMTFRAYCAWKRARALLPYVSTACSLTDLAMQTGYPDSTHFSHSIRRIYGLRPKDILAGSRRLAVVS